MILVPLYYHILQLLFVSSYRFCCSIPCLLFYKLFWYVRMFVFLPVDSFALIILSWCNHFSYTSIWCATFNSICGFLSIRYVICSLYYLWTFSFSLAFLSGLRSFCFVQTDDVHIFSFSHDPIKVFVKFYN